jgi:hypothetical protein
MKEYESIFDDPKAINFLLPHRRSNSEITLQKNARIPYQNIYPLLHHKIATFNEYITISLASGMIVLPTLPAGSIIFLLKKKTTCRNQL